jgi:hypothetical protein
MMHGSSKLWICENDPGSGCKKRVARKEMTHISGTVGVLAAIASLVACSTQPPSLPTQAEAQEQIAGWGEDSNLRMKCYTGWKSGTREMAPYEWLSSRGVFKCNSDISFYPSCVPGPNAGDVRFESPQAQTMMVVRIGSVKADRVLNIERAGPKTANVLVSTRFESGSTYEQYKDAFNDIERLAFGERSGASNVNQRWLTFELDSQGKWRRGQ